MGFRVLAADDDVANANLIKHVLTGEGYEVAVAAGGREAVRLGEQGSYDVAFLDVMMPDLNGLEVLRALKGVNPDTIVIMMTAFGSIETAIEAINEGAYDYVKKPFDIAEIKIRIEQAMGRRKLISENAQVKNELKEKYQVSNIIGASEPMLNLYKRVARVAPTDATVLIQGETGTGKELVARAIHYNSRRADSPFVTIDCSSLPENLVESEMFGHVKGSFTGAGSAKKGLFEAAEGGTCFLDEIGEISPNIQSKLLRVLQEHEVRRVGANDSTKVNVRVITATNRQLQQLVDEEKFRKDLYYRLSVVTIAPPPLRERTEDIPVLADYFLRKYSTTHGKSVASISPEAMNLLVGHQWPGNVRELEHAIEQAVALGTDPVLSAEDLPMTLRRSTEKRAASQAPVALKDAIRKHIEAVLKHANGNKSLAAEILGIPRRTLYRLGKRYDISLMEQR